MTRYELRWARRHPGRWLMHWWLHMIVGTSVIAMGWLWTFDVFSVVLIAGTWPILASIVGTLIIASALAPLEFRLVATASAAMVALGVVRALGMVEVAVAEGGDTAAVALVFGLHHVVLAALGMIWPTWTLAVGTTVTVEAGRDDREHTSE